MRFKIILAAIVIVVLGLAIMKSAASKSPGAGNTQSSVTYMTTDKAFHDFGEISMKAGKVRYQAKVKNTKDTPVIITKLHTSCMCTKSTMTVGGQTLGPFGMEGHGDTVPRIDFSLAPGQEAQVEVEFDPAAHGPSGIGLIERSVFVDMSGGARTELKFKATVKP